MLNQRLDEPMNVASGTVNDMVGFSETFADPSDRATLESERSSTLRIRDREKMLIEKLKEALEKIENGRYGICEECGEDISEGRLEARPVTTLCIECKNRQEAEEKLKGR